LDKDHDAITEADVRRSADLQRAGGHVAQHLAECRQHRASGWQRQGIRRERLLAVSGLGGHAQLTAVTTPNPLSGNTVHVISDIVMGTNASGDNRHLELPTRSGTIIPVDTTVALHKSQGAAPRIADAIQVSGAYVRRTVLLATTVRTAPGKADSWESDR
jgi:hypothetical protein